MNFGFLFDIDGCLTLPGYDKSVLDIELMDKILDMDNPIALVTGRSDGWLRQQYAELDRLNFLNFTTYIEFGLAFIQHQDLKFQSEGQDFIRTRLELIRRLAVECELQNIYFEPEIWYSDFPNHGSLWVEKKYIQLSIAANRNISTPRVHEIVTNAWKEVEHQARWLPHHLGIDVVPLDWSKSKATEHFISNLNESEYLWYVFGDNESDKEMVYGLTNVEFISTKNGASQVVRKKLQDLEVL